MKEFLHYTERYCCRSTFYMTFYGVNRCANIESIYAIIPETYSISVDIHGIWCSSILKCATAIRHSFN